MRSTTVFALLGAVSLVGGSPCRSEKRAVVVGAGAGAGVAERAEAFGVARVLVARNHTIKADGVRKLDNMGEKAKEEQGMKKEDNKKEKEKEKKEKEKKEKEKQKKEKEAKEKATKEKAAKEKAAKAEAADEEKAAKAEADKAKSKTEMAKADKSQVDQSQADKSQADKSKSQASDSPTDKSQADKFQVEKSQAQKSQVDQSQADKSQASSSQANKSQADKAAEEKTGADTVKADAVKADAVKADAGKTDAVKADASKTDAVKADAAKAKVVQPPATTTAPTASKAVSQTGAVAVSRAGGVLNPSAAAEANQRDNTATRAFSSVSLRSAADGQCLFVDPTAGDFRENLIPVQLKACDGSPETKFDIITKGKHNDAAGAALIVSTVTQGCLNFDDRRAAGDTVIMFSCGGRADGDGRVANSQLFPFTGAKTFALSPENGNGRVCLVPSGGKLDQTACNGQAGQEFTIE